MESSSLSDSLITAEERFARADGKPYQIGVRGDKAGRWFALACERHCANGAMLWTSDATSCRTLMNKVRGLNADERLCSEHTRLEHMPWDLRDAFLSQFDHGLLEAKSLDLLVIDTEVEYLRAFWRHRQKGWIVWFPVKYIRDLDAFEAEFLRLEVVDGDELATEIEGFVSAVRENHPGVQVLVLTANGVARNSYQYDLVLLNNRLLSYAHRTKNVSVFSFDGLDVDGRQVEDGERIFTEIVEHHYRFPSKPQLQNVQEVPGDKVVESIDVPQEGVINYHDGGEDCDQACQAAIDSIAVGLSDYVLNVGDFDFAKKRYTPAIIPASEMWDYERWERTIHKLTNGNRTREKRKALNAGYFVRPFEYLQYTPDIHAINHSMPIRSGGAMRGSYTQTLEEMGDVATDKVLLQLPTCRHHWLIRFGVFRRVPGRKQGEVVVDDQLLGYVALRRVGTIALYAQILGHGDFLHESIMVLLHHEIVRWLSSQQNGYADGLEYLMYGGIESGGDGLRNWKRRAGFRPLRLRVSR